jgi:hypothetical protein
MPNVLDFIEPGAVALLIVTLMTGTLAFIRGWIVPRFIYDHEVERADDATQTLSALTIAVKSLTEEVRARGRSNGGT